MFTVRLHKMKFFAHHGWHDEEGITGTAFEVSLAVEFDPQKKITHLDETMNYVTLHDIVKEKFLHPSRLLETLAQDIAETIHSTDQRIRSINISIDKVNAPIENFSGTAGISYSKIY